jgi:hypothetical protein
VQRGDDWAKTNRYTNNRTGNTTRTVRTDEGSAVMRRGSEGGRVGVGDEGNIYAGKDGNAYRRQDGTWQKYDNGSWSNTDKQPGPRPEPSAAGQRPTERSTTGERPSSMDQATRDQLNRDAAARREGTQRTGDYGGYRSNPTPRSGGSYRGGGGARGGGRRR